MGSRAAALIVVVGAVGCRRTETSPAAPDAMPPASAVAVVAPPPSARPSAVASAAVPTRDFEDQFAYGGFDAGAADASALAKQLGFKTYSNSRFGFAVDVPESFVAMPAPDNGDGMQWRLGNLASMTASGMHALDDWPAVEQCAASPNVTAHNETKTSCFATGKRGGFIFWERAVIAHGEVYTLRFEYVESLKVPMDPIVVRVNKSWSF